MLILTLLVVLLFPQLSCAQRQPARTPVTTQAALPESVRLYEDLRQQGKVPTMQVWGVEYGGLSLCRLLERRTEPQPFWVTGQALRIWSQEKKNEEVTYEGLERETCDLTGVIVGYGGFCAGCLAHAASPRLAQPLMPQVEIVAYGDRTVIYLNDWRVTPWMRTPAGEQAAVEWLKHLPPTIKPNNDGIRLIPLEFVGYPAQLQ